MIDILSFNSYIRTDICAILIAIVVVSGVVALSLICLPVFIIVLTIIYCVKISTRRTQTIQRVTQPDITTIEIITTEQHVPQQQCPSGYSAYPPGGVYTNPDDPPQNNTEYPDPVQSASYPTNDIQPQVMSILDNIIICH